MNITAVGIDLAKNVFQVHAVDARGKVVLRKQLRRAQVAGFFSNMPPCLIGMEACASAHHWGRTFERFGHTVRLMASQFVKPYVKTNKNDVADAEAICEAVGRRSMRFVPIKSVEQQAILSVHRVRQGFVKARTAQANQIRGLLGEFGLVIPQGIYNVAKRVPELLEDASNELPVPFRHLIERLTQHLKELDRQVKEFEKEIIEWHRSSELSRKLEAIPGIGPLAASALVASIADAHSFDNGRQVSAWLGLVPRQSSSGGKPTLLGMSKRGDAYLRTLLIHGARSAILAAKNKVDNTQGWLTNLLRRRHPNIAAVALANKKRTYRVGAACPRARVPGRLYADPDGRVVGKAYRPPRQNRRTHHRLLRRSSSEGKTG
jgi:transposase